MNSSLRLFAASAAFILIVGTSGDRSEAKEKLTVWEGTRICTEWCIANNKSLKKQIQCSQRCDKYWSENGSDAAHN